MTGRLTYTVLQVCEAVSTSHSLLYQEIQAGRLRILKLGRKTLITDAALREWVDLLESNTRKKRAESRKANAPTAEA